MAATISPVPVMRLLNAVEIPQLGLGTWPMNDAEAAVAVCVAIDMGYRLIDTAEAYRNEVGVGEAIRRSSVRRENIFLTTKFNKQWHRVQGARAACEASLRRLKLDYIDLLLIHCPNPDQDRFVESFQGLMRLLKAGVVRSIGTSNFKPKHLARLLALDLVPDVNQIELNPYHPRTEFVAIHTIHDIVTECWRPLGRGSDLLAEPITREIARRYGRTVGQVILNWHIQSGYIATPKSSDPMRQAENLDIFDFVLMEHDMLSLNQLGSRPNASIINADEIEN